MSSIIDGQSTVVRCRRGPTVKRLAITSLSLLSLSLGLVGCISSSSPPPPANATVVVPPGSTAICSDGTTPPCR